MRLHVVGLPHTETTEDFFTCAYTQKLVKFGPMMLDQGYEVILYSGEVNTTPCTEHVPIISREEQQTWFGTDWQTQQALPTIRWEIQLPYWRAMNRRAIRAISDRLDTKNDLVLLIGGLAQQPIANGLPGATICEFGVGYSGVFTDKRVFESYAWMHHIYGLRHTEVGNFYDTVIPNYFKADDFDNGKGGDYLLFLGRLIRNKGPQVAAEISDRTGIPLIMAGNGCVDQRPGEVVCPEFTITGKDIQHVGPADIQRRRELMAGAKALVMPTLYLEPFGGVAVEAMMSGTPVIAPDWGAFTETIQHGETGFRFHTLREACEGVERVDGLDRQEIRDYAIGRYSLEAVGPMYDRYFRQLQGLWGDGWYS